jgi:hypothetical protein
MKLIIALCVALLAEPAVGQEIEPGPGISMHPIQYMFAWYDDGHESRTIFSLLDALREDRGMDQMLQDRATRIQQIAMHPKTRIVGPAGSPQWQYWFEVVGINYTWRDAAGRPWHVYKFLLDEFVLTGVAASRWFCDPRNTLLFETKLDAEIDDATAFCLETNRHARDIYQRLNNRRNRTGVEHGPDIVEE